MQVRYVTKEKNRQESIYLGNANSIAQARQIQMENLDYHDSGYGHFYLDNKRIS